MRFIIEENGRPIDAPLGHSPELDLVHGQPVSITIVNHLDEPDQRALAWHRGARQLRRWRRWL
jgi:hypothetical protein